MSEEYPLRDDLKEAIALIEGVADGVEELDLEDADVSPEAVEDIVEALREQANTLTFASAAVTAFEQLARKEDA